MDRFLAKLPEPYTLVLVALVATLLLNAPSLEYLLWSGAIVGSSAILDVTLDYVRNGKAKPSKSSLISTLIIAGVADPTNPLTLAIALALVAFRHLCRTIKGPFPVVNPAAGALFLGVLLNPTLELWWANSNLLLLGVLGFLVAAKIRRLYTSFSFLIAWAITALAIIHPFPLSLHHFPFFLAFYMLTEPKTTPVQAREQVAFGVGVALMEHAFSKLSLPSSALLSLLVANLLFKLKQLYFAKNK